MPILKFWNKDGQIVLDKLRMEDISQDKRTALINKQSFIQDKYKIDNGVYLALNDIFFKMSKMFNKSAIPINAMLINDGETHIIIVPSRSYVFWNGKSVEPSVYELLQSENDIQSKLVNC